MYLNLREPAITLFSFYILEFLIHNLPNNTLEGQGHLIQEMQAHCFSGVIFVYVLVFLGMSSENKKWSWRTFAKSICVPDSQAVNQKALVMSIRMEH